LKQSLPEGKLLYFIHKKDYNLIIMNLKQLSFLALIISILLTACTDYETKEEVLDLTKPVKENRVDRDKILELVNNYRIKGVTCKGVSYPPVSKVRWNNQLEHMAYNHSKDMKSLDYFDHVSADGRKVSDRAKEVEYKFKTIGENIAWGQKNEKSVVDAWINSPGHCRNIMNKNFKEMGVGRVGVYWTQNFGSSWD
jgi:uncharacterized protein YkwD